MPFCGRHILNGLLLWFPSHGSELMQRQYITPPCKSMLAKPLFLNGSMMIHGSSLRCPTYLFCQDGSLFWSSTAPTRQVFASYGEDKNTSFRMSSTENPFRYGRVFKDQYLLLYSTPLFHLSVWLKAGKSGSTASKPDCKYNFS